MNAERTKRLVDAWFDLGRGTQWEELLSEAVARLLPDTDDWFVLAIEDEKIILALDDEALYRMEAVDLETQTAMSVERLKLETAGVVETLEQVHGGRMERLRTWAFTLEGNRALGWATRESLEEGESGPTTQGERFARALARLGGWPL